MGRDMGAVDCMYVVMYVCKSVQVAQREWLDGGLGSGFML